MFITAFATLGALCSLITSAPNNSFRVVNRYYQSNDSYVSRKIMEWDGNSVSFEYLNDANYYGVLDLDTFYDRVFLTNSDGSTVATLSWYLTRPNNGTDFYFNFDTNNWASNPINLRILFGFSVYNDALEEDVYNNYFDIDFSKLDYENQYHYIDSEASAGFDLTAGLNGALTGKIFISYVPISEAEFNNLGTYNEGYENGYETGYSDGNNAGYQNGYTAGYTEGASQDETAVAIFSGIISVGLIPINFFLACLNFEVFGINIGAFVSALLTIAIVVIITRMIVSGGNGGNNG